MRIAFAALALCAVLPSKAACAQDAAYLYGTQCASCHGAHGEGSNVAPSLIGKSAPDIHFMLDTGRMPASVPDVNEIHREPRFTQPQMAELVRYILSFSPVRPSASLPLVMPGDVARGRALFAENCAQCHGAAGSGASIGAADVAPSLGEATVFQVAEAIRAGPSVMPRFGPDVLSDQDVSDIARYVNYSQTQAAAPEGEDAGGFSLGHVGPVAEGFAAWLFGLGALVLFVRAIGTAGKDG
ncbi:MAG: c-type cytochrome [Candidatus Eremiobacteraeota bacterium]|nr:c-type cytochrome [Candidatus Eremiobacteraeota bacterium]